MNALQLYKCLSDETRLKTILLVHMTGELCVCELTVALDEIQPKISRHLAQLKKCGLLTDRKQGTWVFYRINPDLEEWVRDVIQTTLSANKEYIAENLNNIEQMSNRPDRADLCS